MCPYEHQLSVAGHPMQAAPPTLDVQEWYPGEPPQSALVLGDFIQ
jgi:hypothetical protein